MKILFIVPYPTEGPSNRFRVEQYLGLLSKNGVSFTVRPFCNAPFYNILLKKGYVLRKIFYLIYFAFSRFIDLMRSPYYDIVFIHREAFPAKDCIFEFLFRKLSKKLIYDFDDAIFLKKPFKVKAVISMADTVIAGNNFLKRYADNFNKRVEVLPTCIDTSKYTPRTRRVEASPLPVVIGWIGTPSTSVYLSGLKDAFKALKEKYKNIELKIVGSHNDYFLGLPAVNKRWSLSSEIEDLRSFDIGVMPMPDNEWTKGKCAFKIIQYMAVGIPVVASPVGMNNEVIRDGVNGFLADTPEEWLDRLSRLIASDELRRSMGQAGRSSVEEKYSVVSNFPAFFRILKNV